MQHSKLTFSKSRLLATFNCKMVAIKKFWSPKKKIKKINNNNNDCNIQGRTHKHIETPVAFNLAERVETSMDFAANRSTWGGKSSAGH